MLTRRRTKEGSEQRRLLIVRLRGRKTLGREDGRRILRLWIWRFGKVRGRRSGRGLIWSLASRKKGLRREWRNDDANDRLGRSLGRILLEVRGEAEGSKVDDLEDEVVEV